MIDPSVLVSAVRDVLRLMPAVVNLTQNDKTRIRAFSDRSTGRSLGEAIAQMEHSAILVAWLGNEPSRDEDMGAWIHRIGIFLRVEEAMPTVFSLVCNGVGTDGQRFTETEIHPSFEQLGVPQFLRDTDEEGSEYPRIELRLRQRSHE